MQVTRREAFGGIATTRRTPFAPSDAGHEATHERTRSGQMRDPLMSSPFDPRRRADIPSDPAAGPTDPTSSGGDDGSSSSDSDPFNRLADAFISALGGGSGMATAPVAPYVVDSGSSSSEGSGMSVKTIVIGVAIIFAAWYAWKKWGKPAASE